MNVDSLLPAWIAAAFLAWPLCTPVSFRLYSGFCSLSAYRFLMGADGEDVKCM